MNESNQQPSDGTLIADVLSGRRERFAILVERYQAALLRVARSRLGRRDWAEDVVQEAFFCAFKSLHSYDSRFSFRTWLWTILLNQCRRHVQKRARRPFVHVWSEQPRGEDDAPSLADDLVGDESPPFASMMREERAARLEQMLRQLPDNQADALRLRFYGGLQFQEIADAMQCSLSTAKNRVRWGLTSLSQQTTEKDAEALIGERVKPFSGERQ